MVHFKCLRYASGHEYNNSKELRMNKKGFTKIILKWIKKYIFPDKSMGGSHNGHYEV